MDAFNIYDILLLINAEEYQWNFELIIVMTLICQITPEMLCKGSANALFDILRLKILRKWKYIFKNSPQQAPFRDAGTHKCYLCCYIVLLLEELALKVNAVSTVSPRLGKTNY